MHRHMMMSWVLKIYLQSANPLNSAMVGRGKRGVEESKKFENCENRKSLKRNNIFHIF